MDWATIASLATAGGTLVLAVATFASTRSANHAARVSERALLVGLRPVLMPARADDPPEVIRFGDDHWLRLSDGLASTAVVDGRLYLAMQLRNVAAGLAVLHGWHLRTQLPEVGTPPADVREFRPQLRDLYVPAGSTGFWQAAVRDPDDPLHAPLSGVISTSSMFTLDLLYGDHEGGQRTVTRFLWTRRGDHGIDDPGAPSQWFCSAVRHHSLDGRNPR